MRFDADMPVLYVDDDDIERRVFGRSMRRAGLPNPLLFADNGQEALHLLRQDDRVERRPGIVLLDMYMPRMNGLEFLDELRGDDDLAQVVVFALSASQEGHRLWRASEYEVAGYLMKPVDAQDLVQAIHDLDGR